MRIFTEIECGQLNSRLATAVDWAWAMFGYNIKNHYSTIANIVKKLYTTWYTYITI